VGGTDTSGRSGVYEVDARTGDATPILDRMPSHFASFLNGKELVFVRSGAIVSHDLQTRRDTELYRPTAPSVLGPCVEVSRNGGSLAFYVQDPETRSTRVMVMTVADQSTREWGTRVQYPERIDDILTLAPDGRHVLYTTYDLESATRVHKVWRIAGGGGAPQEIRLPMARLDTVRTANFHPDGRQIVFSSTPYKQVMWVMENFVPKASAAR